MQSEDQRLKRRKWERDYYARVRKDPVKWAKYSARRIKYFKGYYAKNKIERLAKDKIWRANNSEKHRAKAREWKRKNPEKHKAHVLKARAKYAAKYPDKILARAHQSASTRRMRMLGIVGDPIRVRELKKHFNDSQNRGDNVFCSYCTIPVRKGNVIWYDHVIPVSKGGPDIPENIVPACRRCNISKRDKLLRDWIHRPLIMVRWTPLDSEFPEHLRVGDIPELLRSLIYTPSHVPDKWKEFIHYLR